MDKSVILRLFLTQGTQINKSALDFLAENPILVERVLNFVKSKLPPIITLEFLNTLDTKPTEKQTSIDQLSQTLNYRYEFLCGLISEKEELTNLISINKINEKIKEFSVIGIVFEKNDYLTVEYNTGQDTFSIGKELSEYIVEDEVLGLVCERQSGINKVKNVIYPDIPLKREKVATETKENYVFLSDIHMESQSDKNYYKNLINWLEKQKDIKIFLFGGNPPKIEDMKNISANIQQPVFVYNETQKSPVLFTAGNLSIAMIYGPFIKYYMDLWGTPPDATVIDLIKKRNLNPILTPSYYNNSFLLEKIPDIIVIGGVGKPSSTNYKGTTIIITGSFDTEPVYWQINLQTRETFKIDLS